MTEELTPLATVKPKRPGGANQLLIDLGPVTLFVLTLNVLRNVEAVKDSAIYIAVAVFMAATIAAIVYCWLKEKRVPPVLIVVGVLVMIFGGLTLWLRDPAIFQIKPTVTYSFYAAAVLGSLLIGQNVWKLLFKHAFSLPDRIWTVLALRWSAFFIFQAVLNEVIRQTQTFEFWTNMRIPVVLLTFVFAAINTPIVLKHHQDPEEEAAPPAAGA